MLERTIDLQTVKIGESDVQVGFSKRYLGFFEIFIFYPILGGPKSNNRKKKPIPLNYFLFLNVHVETVKLFLFINP